MPSIDGDYSIEDASSQSTEDTLRTPKTPKTHQDNNTPKNPDISQQVVNGFVQPIFTVPSEAQYQAYLQCRAHELALQAQQNYNSAITAINNEFTTNATGNFAVMPGFQTPIQTGAAAGYYSMFSKRTAISNVSFPSQPVQPSQVIPVSSLKGRASTKQLEQWQWSNQTMVFDVPEINLHKGMPHFRWALCHIDTSKPTKDGTQRRKYYCLGCYKCPTPGCTFLERPRQPNPKSFAVDPPEAKKRCMEHDTKLEFVRCTGGDPLANPKKSISHPPCTIVTITTPGLKSVKVQHYGIHNHPRPPPAKLAPISRQKLKKAVESNPEAGPAKLKMGTNTRPPVDKIDEVLVNIDRLKYHRERILNSNKLRGIKGGIGAFMTWHNDLPKDDERHGFCVQFQILDKKRQIISFQSSYMREVLSEFSGGIQTDTIEGVIFDAEFSDMVFIHFTSAYDKLNLCWVPVLMSLLFGKTTQHYSAHW